jgi:hypothetical protein
MGNRRVIGWGQRGVGGAGEEFDEGKWHEEDDYQGGVGVIFLPPSCSSCLSVKPRSILKDSIKKLFHIFLSLNVFSRILDFIQFSGNVKQKGKLEEKMHSGGPRPAQGLRGTAWPSWLSRGAARRTRGAVVRPAQLIGSLSINEVFTTTTGAPRGGIRAR